MELHWSLTDAEFEHQFADCTLKPLFFTHEAHLRLACIHIKKYGEEKAIEHLCTQIHKYASSLGEDNKFNKTVTVAAVKAVHHFMKRTDSDNFQSLIKEFPKLKYNFKELLKMHYSFDLFLSDKAKKTFIEPDLLPFS